MLKSAKYLKSFLDLEFEHINSIVDLGAGYGHLFKAMLRTFKPYTAVGIEPSSYAFKKLKAKSLTSIPSTKLKLYQEDILGWCQNKRKESIFDLGICTSVFQYLSEKELKIVILK